MNDTTKQTPSVVRDRLMSEHTHKRTQQSLRDLYDVLFRYAENGGRDFSLANIGRLSASQGGVSGESLKKTRNDHYRKLINAFVDHYAKGVRKPSDKVKKHLNTSVEDDFIKAIPLNVRSYAQRLISEKRMCKDEIQELKNGSQETIDIRPQIIHEVKDGGDYIPAISSICEEYEIEALKKVLSPGYLEERGLREQYDAAIDADGVEILPMHFLSAYRKLLKVFDVE